MVSTVILRFSCRYAPESGGSEDEVALLGEEDFLSLNETDIDPSRSGDVVLNIANQEAGQAEGIGGESMLSPSGGETSWT